MSPRFYRRTRELCALLTSVIGVLALIGWGVGIEILASIRADFFPMAPTTALSFVGLGVVMFCNWEARVGNVLAHLVVGGVVLLSLWTVIHFFGGVSFDLDDRLLPHAGVFNGVTKGRMSPITAMNFLIMSGAIFCLRQVKLRRFAGMTASVVLSVSFILMLGYLHGSPQLYGRNIAPVALPTVMAFLALGVSVVAASGPEYWPLRPLRGDSARAVLLRWFLPAVIAVALVDGFARTRLLMWAGMNPAVSSALSTLMYTIVVTAVIWRVASIVGGRIDSVEAERNAAQQSLETLNRELEDRIADRTRELRSKNDEMEEELTMARELQMALLPQHFPTVPKSVPARDSALRFFSFYIPTRTVSGDFYSVFPISDTSVGIFICDVMGHGVRAALVTSMMRAMVQEHSGPDPGRLLTEINSEMHALLLNAGTTMYATALMVIADVESLEVRYANAGHPKPLHISRRLGETEPMMDPKGKGPALGLFPDAVFHTATQAMLPGDLIMLFTDGLFEVEGPNDEMYSQEDLLAAVRKRRELPSRLILEGVLSEVRGFSRRTDFEDDVCLIGVEMREDLSR